MDGSVSACRLGRGRKCAYNNRNHYAKLAQACVHACHTCYTHGCMHAQAHDTHTLASGKAPHTHTQTHACAHTHAARAHPRANRRTRVFGAELPTKANRLKIRQLGVHGKCNDCEKYKELRRLATSPEESERVSRLYRDHLASQYQDRKMDMLVASHAVEAASSPDAVPLSSQASVVSLCLDGMDQAKFRLPRNVSMAKEMQALWRPEIHMHGGLADGIVESYWLCGLDVKKNANLQATLVGRLLQQVYTVMESRNIPLGSNLKVHTDNATSEGKNQVMMKMMGYLVWKHAFRSAEMSQFRVGHSHNKQDQRFGCVATALARSRRLEVPSRNKPSFDVTLVVGPTASVGVVCVCVCVCGCMLVGAGLGVEVGVGDVGVCCGCLRCVSCRCVVCGWVWHLDCM